jgi:hypothetical protein
MTVELYGAKSVGECLHPWVRVMMFIDIQAMQNKYIYVHGPLVPCGHRVSLLCMAQLEAHDERARHDLTSEVSVQEEPPPVGVSTSA